MEPLLTEGGVVRPVVDTILLGCTHYPLLREAIEKTGYAWQHEGETLPDAMLSILRKTGVRVHDPATGLEFLAAKIYRPRMFRSLSNDALYRQGREQRDPDEGQ